MFYTKKYSLDQNTNIPMFHKNDVMDVAKNMANGMPDLSKIPISGVLVFTRTFKREEQDTQTISVQQCLTSKLVFSDFCNILSDLSTSLDKNANSKDRLLPKITIDGWPLSILKDKTVMFHAHQYDLYDIKTGYVAACSLPSKDAFLKYIDNALNIAIDNGNEDIYAYIIAAVVASPFYTQDSRDLGAVRPVYFIRSDCRSSDIVALICSYGKGRDKGLGFMGIHNLDIVSNCLENNPTDYDKLVRDIRKKIAENRRK